MLGSSFWPAVSCTRRAAGMSSRCHWYVPVRFEMKTVLSASFPTKAQEVKYGWMLLDPSPVSRRTRPPVFGSFDSLISPRTSWTLPRPPLAAGAAAPVAGFGSCAGSAATSGFAAATETAAAPPAAARSVRKCRRSTRFPCEVARSDPDLSRLAMIVPFLSGFTIPVHSPRCFNQSSHGLQSSAPRLSTLPPSRLPP